MFRELTDYEVFPRVLNVNKSTKITIKPYGKNNVFDNEKYTIRIMPMEETREPKYDYDTCVINPVNGNLYVEYTFLKEQMYIIRIFREEDIDYTKESEEYKYNAYKAYRNFHVYALNDDLYNKFAYRGDFHAHSTYSDGKEEPKFVASNYRKNGFDFYFLTDHGQYEPSVICQKDYENSPIDFKIYLGEEVHSKDNLQHVVNCGSKYSVNKVFEDNPELYDKEIQEIINNTDIPEDVDPVTYAATILTFLKIKEAGGMSIYVHPHWRSDVYHSRDAMSRMLFEDRKFDAFEILGGQESNYNNLQTSFYYEYRKDGKSFPIVGSSDSHGTEAEDDWFKWSSTIVFSDKNEQDNIIESVKSCYSVAVEKYPNQDLRVYGEYRYVKYAMFLLDIYFPLHDELCYEEGRLMKDYVLGDENAEKILQIMKGRTDKLRNKYWGKN